MRREIRGMTLVAMVMGLAAIGAVTPRPANAGCSGFSTGDFTFYSCDDGKNFTTQRMGDFTFVSGDLTGYGQRIGPYEFIDVRETVPARGVAPVSPIAPIAPIAPVAAPPVWAPPRYEPPHPGGGRR